MFGILGRLNPFGSGGGEDKGCDTDAILPALANDTTMEVAIKTEDTEQVELPLYQEGMSLLVELREVLCLNGKESEELGVPTKTEGAEAKETSPRSVRKSGGGSARERALHLREHGNNQEKSSICTTSVVARRRTIIKATTEESQNSMTNRYDDQIQGEPDMDDEHGIQDIHTADKRTSLPPPRALACLKTNMITSPDLKSVKLRKVRRRSQDAEAESAAASASVAASKTPAKRSRVSKEVAREGRGVEGSHVKSVALQLQTNGAAPDSPPTHCLTSMGSPEPVRCTRISTRGSGRRTTRGSLL
jgi:hypothetical protein|eukprot:evm.model.NODE_34853_length_18870_cov_29.333174.7